MTKWHKGPPPEIGWWPASAFKNDEVIRWWDGKNWSVGVDKNYTSEQAAAQARTYSDYSNKEILWTERWWLKRFGVEHD
jgi:hypothetical protein